MRRLLKWLAIALLTIVLLLLCVLLLSYFLLGTDKGFKFSVDQISERVEGLQVGDISGNLAHGIQTDRIDFKNEQIAIQADGIDSTWRSKCILSKELCLDEVVIDNLKIETFATDEPKSASTEDITLPEIALPISFNAKKVLVRNLEFQAPGDAPPQVLQDITLSAYSEQNTLHIDELSTQYQNINIHTSGELTTSGDYPLDLNIMIDALDIVEDHDISAEIKLTNSLNDLDVDIFTDGAVTMGIQGQVKPLQKKLPATLRIKTKQVGWPLDTRAMASADNVVIDIDGDMDDYRFNADAKVAGEQIPDTQLKLAGKSNTSRALLTDVTVLTLDGFATGNAAVSWNNGVIWVTELIAKDINPAVKYDGVDGKLNAIILANGDLVDGKWTLDLSKASVDGELRGVPFSLNSKLAKHANESWNIDALTLKNGRNLINATGTLTDKWDATAEITLPDLENLLPDLSGEIAANLSVQGEIKNPDIKLQAKTDSITYQQITIDSLSLNTDVKRGALDPSNLALTVAKVQAGEQAISNARINLSGTRAKHLAKVFADGPQKTSIDLAASGGLNPQFDWAGALNNVKLEVPAHEIVLNKPTNLEWNNQAKKFSIDPHCWAIQESSLCLKNRVLAEEEGKAVVALDTYRLNQLNPFLPAESELRGRLNAEVTVDWGDEFAGGYAASLKADVEDGAINVRDTSGQPLSFKYDTLTLQSSADANSLASTLTIDSDSMGQARANLSLDPASENKNITGNIDLSGFQLGFLKAFLPNYETISGSVSAKGDLSGELLDPLYNGDVVVSSLVVRSDDLPVAIDDGKLTAKIKGKRAELDGNLKSGDGNLGISGTANWLNSSYRADIKLQADALTVVSEPVTDSTVNAKLTLSVQPERIRIRGAVDIPDAQINIKEIPRGAASVSDDVIVVEEIYAQTQSKQKKQQSATVIDLKINVSLGDDVNLSGYGLNAALTGAIALSQTSPNPIQLGGEVTIVEGTFKQYGQDLTITDGQVLFVGPIDQTSLNIDAVRVIQEPEGERIAGLHLDGQIQDPEITLFTEPADKTQESILAYIVLGRDLGGASSSESQLLASAALALTLKGGRAYTDDLAESLGLQEISLDARSGDDNTTEVVVSSRVNDKLLVRYGRNVFNGSDTLYLRYDLTKQLYLEAAEGADSAVDIFYKFAF